MNILQCNLGIHALFQGMFGGTYGVKTEFKNLSGRNFAIINLSMLNYSLKKYKILCHFV